MDNINVVKIAEKITYKDWVLHTGVDESYLILWWSWHAPDAVTGAGMEVWTSAPTFFPQREVINEEHFVRLAFRNALQAEEHECREFFQYNGQRPFNPHVSLVTEKI